MADNFIALADGFFVGPQIGPEDLAAAKALGVTLIINNRPDGEEFGQPKGAEIETAARESGLVYIAIPISGGRIGPDDIDAFDRALAGHQGGVLAYCRSGTRSMLLWALARARAGERVDRIIGEAEDAGYDIAGQRRALEAASRSGSGRG